VVAARCDSTLKRTLLDIARRRRLVASAQSVALAAGEALRRPVESVVEFVEELA
jgi:hypothetical protein